MCDILDKARISTIDELEEELSKAIKLVKNFELDKKLDKLSEDF
jgi:predicted RNase H-like HicB family nuclease